MGQGRESTRSESGINTPIITTAQVGDFRPRSLLNAVSEIQQFYVIESKGQDIPGEFLTLERTIDFFKIGIKSGFHEGVVLIFLFPLFHFYLFPFVFRPLDIHSRILFGCVPYMVLIINTLMCGYISRYYVGNITRKSVNSLLMARAMSLAVKAFLLYVAYLIIFRASTPENVWKAAQWFGDGAEKFYYGYLTIKPRLLPVASESALLMLVAAVFPHGTVYLLDLWHKSRVKRHRQLISG